jgi:benzodiazapine receptor
MMADSLKSAGKVATFVMICEMTAIIGIQFVSTSTPEWYGHLNAPFFTTPDWLFAPVFIVLYAMMGFADYLIWKRGYEKADLRDPLEKTEVNNSLNIFVIQLTLGLFWAILFFGVRSPLFAFVEILVLWVALAYTLMMFYRISKPAGYLLAPYMLWVSYSAVLNCIIWIMN